MDETTGLLIAIAAIAVVFFIAGKIGKIFRKICRFLEKVHGIISWPLDKLIEKICDGISNRVKKWLQDSSVMRISERLHFFGGLNLLLFFLGALLFVVGSFLYFAQNRNEGQIIFEALLFGTTMGSVITLIMDGFAFDLTTLVSAGFASFLAIVCMRKTAHLNKGIGIVYNMVFIAMSSVLGVLLTGAFSAVAKFGIDTFDALTAFVSSDREATFGILLLAIGIVLLLLFLLYLGLVLLIITVKEYAASICYGIRAMAALLAIGMLMQNYLELSEWGFFFVILALIVYTEYVRAEDEAAPDRAEFNQKKHKLKNFFFRKRSIEP